MWTPTAESVLRLRLFSKPKSSIQLKGRHPFTHFLPHLPHHSPVSAPHSLLQLKCILYWYGLLLFCSIKLKLVRRWHDKMFNNKVKNIIVISRVFNSEILGRLKISRFSPFLWPFVKNRSLFPFSEWVFLYIYTFVFSIFKAAYILFWAVSKTKNEAELKVSHTLWFIKINQHVINLFLLLTNPKDWLINSSECQKKTLAPNMWLWLMIIVHLDGGVTSYWTNVVPSGGQAETSTNVWHWGGIWSWRWFGEIWLIDQQWLLI